jgi:hypothetical protein
LPHRATGPAVHGTGIGSGRPPRRRYP